MEEWFSWIWGLGLVWLLLRRILGGLSRRSDPRGRPRQSEAGEPDAPLWPWPEAVKEDGEGAEVDGTVVVRPKQSLATESPAAGPVPPEQLELPDWLLEELGEPPPVAAVPGPVPPRYGEGTSGGEGLTGGEGLSGGEGTSGGEGPRPFGVPLPAEPASPAGPPRRATVVRGASRALEDDVRRLGWQRAYLLTEILGPPRARRPYRPPWPRRNGG